MPMLVNLPKTKIGEVFYYTLISSGLSICKHVPKKIKGISSQYLKKKRAENLSQYKKKKKEGVGVQKFM